VLASVFLVSFVVLAFEVSLTRVYSVLFDYHYAFVAVSGAMCGLGLGGLGWHLLQRSARVRREVGLPAGREVGWAGLGFALLIPWSIALLFGSSAIIAAHLWAALIPVLPFIFAGAFLAEVFREQVSESGRLYQADLFGAALAAVLVVPLIGLTGALHMAFPLGGLAGIGAACWALSRRDHGLFFASAATVVFLAASWPASVRADYLRIRPLAGAPSAVTKAMVQEAAGSGQIGSTLDRDWSAYARTDLVRYDSPEAGLYSLQLYTDGGTPSQMTQFHGDSSSLSQLRRELPFIGYDLSPHSTMLSIGPGAGRDFLWGLLAGFSKMEGVEVNASVAAMMDRYRGLNGNLYQWPGVTVSIEDGRSFVRRSRQQYDLISSTLTQTATAPGAGQALVESYIHTQEAFSDYFRHLTPQGRYTLVTESGPLLLRAAFTAIAVMQEHGADAQQACRHLALLALPRGEEGETPYRYLLIWKRSPLTADDLGRLRRAIEAGLAEMVFLPGLGGHRLVAEVASGAATLPEVFAAGLPDGDARSDLRPATDDRPFFLDRSFGAPRVLLWFLLGSFGLAALFSGALLWRRPQRERGPQAWLVYFGALGIGFMLVEIPLIQKFILFLGHPTLSLAGILFWLLIGASLGSGMSQRWPAEMLPRRTMAAAAMVCAIAAAYTLALSPVLSSLLHVSTPGKLLATGVLLVPLGIALGVPFPSGLRLMSGARQGDVPWVWGFNGLMSVVGSVLAAAGGKLIGFNGCLLAAALVYGSLVLIVPRLPRDEAPEGRSAGPRRRRPPPEADRAVNGRRGRISFLSLAPVAAAAALWLLALSAGGGSTDLYQAALRGRTDVVKRLLGQGAAVNARNGRCFGWTPLHAAALAGHAEVTEELLAHGADAGVRAAAGLEWTPLHEAAYAGHTGVAEALLSHGADVNAQDPQGRTPLHSATAAGGARLAELLLARGAEINAPDGKGRTPLHWAALLDQPEMVRLLLARGADVNARTRQGLDWTPIYGAVLLGWSQAVELLIAGGAEVNVRDKQGWTPLHLAASVGKRDQAELLLAAGADPNARDQRGESPLTLAVAKHESATAELLRAHGAR
jgi:ankyrin repeat protein